MGHVVGVRGAEGGRRGTGEARSTQPEPIVAVVVPSRVRTNVVGSQRSGKVSHDGVLVEPGEGVRRRRAQPAAAAATPTTVCACDGDAILRTLRRRQVDSFALQREHDEHGVDERGEHAALTSAYDAESRGARSAGAEHEEEEEVVVEDEVFEALRALLIDFHNRARRGDERDGDGRDDELVPDEDWWASLVALVRERPAGSRHVCPVTRAGPLHLACEALPLGSADLVRALVRARPEAVPERDARGRTALHHAVVAENDYGLGASDRAAEIAALLMAGDYDGSVDWLRTGELPPWRCSPLYRAVAAGQESPLLWTLHEACPDVAVRPESALTDDATVDDTALQLLHRRFVRQEYEKDKFFPGDNSRREIREHRREHARAAEDTWQTIEFFIGFPDRQGREETSVSPEEEGRHRRRQQQQQQQNEQQRQQQRQQQRKQQQRLHNVVREQPL